MSDIKALSGGELCLWADPGGSVMIKRLSKGTDPIELGEGEVDELIQLLTELRREIS
jgi:hypothetical protein